MPMPYSGTLTVHVTTAAGAYPVSGATVRILGRSAGVRELTFAQFTDRDGNTEDLSLPAPDPALSASPNPPASPFSVFDISVAFPGYYQKAVYSVSVFPNVRTVLPVNLIPFSEFEAEQNAPNGSQRVLSGENPDL